MPITVFYTQITTSSGTEVFAAFTFRFSSSSEMHSIVTYAKTEAELREDIEEWVSDCKNSFLGIKPKKDFFNEWKYKFIEKSTEYLQLIDEIDVLVI